MVYAIYPGMVVSGGQWGVRTIKYKCMPAGECAIYRKKNDKTNKKYGFEMEK